MSPTTAMLLPLVGHVALVFVLYGLLMVRRASARAGGASEEIWRSGGDEPAVSYAVNRNLANQFELPMLFYPVCMALYFTDADNGVTIFLAWIFVLARCLHSFEHVTRNRLPWRRMYFLASFLTLAALWSWLAVWIVFE